MSSRLLFANFSQKTHIPVLTMQPSNSNSHWSNGNTKPTGPLCPATLPEHSSTPTINPARKRHPANKNSFLQDSAESCGWAMRDAKALEKRGVRCDVELYPGEVHAFHAFVWRSEAQRFWRDTYHFVDSCLAAKK